MVEDEGHEAGLERDWKGSKMDGLWDGFPKIWGRVAEGVPAHIGKGGLRDIEQAGAH